MRVYVCPNGHANRVKPSDNRIPCKTCGLVSEITAEQMAPMGGR